MRIVDQNGLVLQGHFHALWSIREVRSGCADHRAQSIELLGQLHAGSAAMRYAN